MRFIRSMEGTSRRERIRNETNLREYKDKLINNSKMVWTHFKNEKC
jgi:hypothetical protein